jgi:hypothetical protein
MGILWLKGPRVSNVVLRIGFGPQQWESASHEPYSPLLIYRNGSLVSLPTSTTRLRRGDTCFGHPSCVSRHVRSHLDPFSKHPSELESSLRGAHR